jgi:hypothetical protein
VGITAFPFSSVIDVPTARILGRDDAGVGAAEALTNTEVFAILATGTPSASTYLRGDFTWATVSAGISSLNGLTDATQTFAVGTTGTDVAFVSAAGVHTLNIPDASVTSRGVVTTGTQRFAGIKYFNSGEIRFGTGTNDARITLFANDLFIDANIGRVVFRTNATITSNLVLDGPGIRIGDAVVLTHDAVQILAQRSSTNPQAYRVYNTYTSATSYERLNIAWASNICTIEVTAGSAGGTLRGLRIGGASTSLLGFYGATPVDRPDTITDPTGGGTIDAEARTAISTIIDRLQELGLIA